MGRAVRALLVLTLLLPAGVGAQGAPTIVLVTPRNGALVEGSHVTFVWRVEWPRPPASGTVQVVHRHAADRAFTREVTTTTRTCPVANVNCWTTHRPAETFYGRYYWQVSLTGAVQAASRPSLFMVRGPREESDRARPLVRVRAGTARRGARAVFAARVRDDSGEARLDAELTRQGGRVADGRTGFGPAVGDWTRVRSSRRLPRTLKPGTYLLCVTAWDRAGNRGRGCARYRVC